MKLKLYFAVRKIYTMKNLLIISIFFNAFLFGQVPLECYSNHITKIDNFDSKSTDFSDFEFLKKEFKDKRIIVLGEAGHGDGASFEAKTKLVKFLVEEMDYSTLAFEGGSFTEMAFASDQINKGKDAVAEIKKSWYSLWSDSKQIQDLLKYIDKKESLNLLGIENQLGNKYSWNLASIYKILAGESAFNDVDFEHFDHNMRNYYHSTFGADTAISNQVDIEKLKSDLAKIKNNVESIDSINAKIVHQGILNIEGLMTQLELGKGSYQQQNKSISMRDSLMAENVKWYLNEYPEEKIIIWTANFHATRTLEKAIYKENDDFYQVFNSLTNRLIEKYGDDVYSVAFTSITGEQAFNFHEEVWKIDIPEDSWDYQMASAIDHDYAFINFKEIRKNPNCGNLIFNSTILGYKSHIGDWFNVFDGVFLIREMYRSDLVE